MMTVITGGSGSGKSAYAEDLLVTMGDGPRIYIATMFPFDEESRKRIQRHRQMRCEKQFTTIERYTGLKELELPPGAFVLLECMSNLVANEMYQADGAGRNTVPVVLEGILELERQAGQLVVVTNEIHSDGICYDEETTRYQRYLGEINQALGRAAGRVVEVVYGIPLTVKENR